MINGCGALLRGKSGAGKSDLALRLIQGGARLIADDQTELLQDNDTLIASCPLSLQGKLEVRGIGIVDMPFRKQHTLHCIIDLMPWKNIERLPTKQFEILDGVTLPRYELDPFEPSALAKIHLITEELSALSEPCSLPSKLA